MGSPEGQGNDFERPTHEVTIAKPFAVAKFELTFDDWDACAAHGDCAQHVSDSGWGRGRRPAINVNWNDAQTYIKWLSRITGKPYRLLSEAEYEYAARAGTETKYPWGDEIKLEGKAMANCDGCGSQWDGKKTAPVGSFAPNGFDLYDMVGNVWEWTEDCWNDNYEGAPANGSAWTSGDCIRRVVRGGPWNDDPRYVRSASRRNVSAGDRFNLVGFRVARTHLQARSARRQSAAAPAERIMVLVWLLAAVANFARALSSASGTAARSRPSVAQPYNVGRRPLVAGLFSRGRYGIVERCDRSARWPR